MVKYRLKTTNKRPKQTARKPDSLTGPRVESVATDQLSDGLFAKVGRVAHIARQQVTTIG